MHSIIHQNLLTTIEASNIPIKSAAISYLPDRLLTNKKYSKQQFCDSFCQNKPYALALLKTHIGNILNISIPMFESDLYLNQANTIKHIEEAILIASEMDAKAVTLTGLLPSASNHGEALFKNDIQPSSKIMTGHDITHVAMLLTLEKCLDTTHRNLVQETVGFLGLGAIGTQILQILMRHYQHPKKIILCDLYKNKEKLQILAASLREHDNFTGEILIVDSHDKIPEAFYASTLIIGASNVPNIIEVHQLQPGTIIIDDSAPPALSLEDARCRFEKQHDILYIEAGLLRSPYPIQQIISLPKGLDVPLFKNDDESCFEIAGCILSGLVTDLEKNKQSFKNNYAYLQQLAFSSPRFQFHGYFHEKTPAFQAFVKDYKHGAFSSELNRFCEK